MIVGLTPVVPRATLLSGVLMLMMWLMPAIAGAAGIPFYCKPDARGLMISLRPPAGEESGVITLRGFAAGRLPAKTRGEPEAGTCTGHTSAFPVRPGRSPSTKVSIPVRSWQLAEGAREVSMANLRDFPLEHIRDKRLRRLLQAWQEGRTGRFMAVYGIKSDHDLVLVSTRFTPEVPEAHVRSTPRMMLDRLQKPDPSSCQHFDPDRLALMRTPEYISIIYHEKEIMPVEDEAAGRAILRLVSIQAPNEICLIEGSWADPVLVEFRYARDWKIGGRFLDEHCRLYGRDGLAIVRLGDGWAIVDREDNTLMELDSRERAERLLPRVKRHRWVCETGGLRYLKP